ncbi:MAG: MBL fold metallo-hydrolase [Dehalococcoidia bacterium]
MSEVRVRFLGTGSPFAPGGRMQSCIVVESDEGQIMLDCGAMALVGMARAGIEPETIDAVLLTHLHGDHFGGLPFLILQAALQARDVAARRGPIRIAGPPETEGRVRMAIRAFGYEEYVAPAWDAGLVEFVTLEPMRETAIGPARVTAFPVVHTPEAVALRVAVGGRTIGYSGDTAWTDTLLDVAADTDLFICLAYTFDSPTSSMVSHRAIMEHRDRLTCKRLILTHLDADMHRRAADAEAEVAEDGMIIDL